MAAVCPLTALKKTFLGNFLVDGRDDSWHVIHGVNVGVVNDDNWSVEAAYNRTVILNVNAPARRR
jgi:hypothetical protein